jgi:phospholipid/cholesterol/gamma-HCH transport system ATP-binding protein
VLYCPFSETYPRYPMMRTLLDVQSVTKLYSGKTVLKRISLSVKEGETVAIIGQSGCGKSTLLKLIAGLETPDHGEIIRHDDRLTLIFQYSALFDSLTVFENVAFPLMNPPDKNLKQHTPPDDAWLIAQVQEKLALLGLSGVECKYPSELSGGMQKRVSFARGIMTNPRIILYDEPTAGLDPIASKVLEEYIARLAQELQAASIVVTHTLSTIFRTAQRVIMLHQGNLHWEGTPWELLEAKDPFVHEFIQSGLIQPQAPTDISKLGGSSHAILG